MRNLDTLSPHSMSRARTVLAFLLICLGEMLSNSGQRTHSDAWFSGAVPSLQMCFCTKGCLGYIATSVTTEIFGQTSVIGSKPGGGKNLNFSKLSNPANALNCSLWQILICSIFAVKKEGMNAKMSFGDGIARLKNMESS